MDLNYFKDIFAKERSKILEDYFTFLRFQSISTDPAYRPQVRACATWLKDYLKDSGLNVDVWESDGAPILFATDLRAGPEKETLLLYCHYDVQPVDPIELWTTPPFEPQIRDGKVYARGSADNKGQCFYTICALKALLRHFSTLPVNLKFLIEGEEESGSVSLSRLLKEKKKELKADHILIVDSGIEAPNQPSISLGSRGLVCFTLTLTGSRFDLHSGTHGGVVYNPNRALVELLASLHDEQGIITVPGFYDDVEEASPTEKQIFKLDFDAKLFEKEFGALPIGMEKGRSAYEAAWLRPTLEINGLSGGYGGAGFKTVIPAKATAKISCRLVPHQHPLHIAELVKNYLFSLVPKGLTLDVTIHPGHGLPYRAHPQSRIATLASQAYSDTFQKPCSYILLGGSIPIAADLAKVAEAELVLIGVGLSTDQIHAPDEHFDLDRLEQGYLALCRIFQLFK